MWKSSSDWAAAGAVAFCAKAVAVKTSIGLKRKRPTSSQLCHSDTGMGRHTSFWWGYLIENKGYFPWNRACNPRTRIDEVTFETCPLFATGKDEVERVAKY